MNAGWGSARDFAKLSGVSAGREPAGSERERTHRDDNNTGELTGCLHAAFMLLLCLRGLQPMNHYIGAGVGEQGYYCNQDR